MCDPEEFYMNTNRLEAFRISQLYTQNSSTQWTGLLNGIIFCIAMGDTVSHLSLGIWLGVFIVIFAARSMVRAQFLRSPLTRDPKFWEDAFVLGTLCSGLVWGVATWFLVPPTVAHMAFVGFLLAGTTAGASVAYCVSIRSIYAFIFPALVPYAINLAIQDSTFLRCMAALLILYIALFSKLTHRMNEWVVNAMKLRFEKEDILNELHTAQAQVTQSVKMAALGEMAAGIAHEINNPLGIIRGSAQLMNDLASKDALTMPRIKVFTEQIDRTVDRIAKIVTGLKYFAREGQNDPLEKHSVGEIIEDTLSYCRARFRSHGIALNVTESRPDLLVECRDVQISQVILNLLNNAFDAVQGSSEGAVTVDVKDTGSAVQISVSDTGRGIPKDLREKIMQPFFTTKEVGKGTGLGLCVARGIVESHGGKLFLDETSVDTKFVMTLPRQKNVVVQEQESEASA